MVKNKIASDSIFMAIVKILSLCTGIVTTMILSRTLPLSEYGTYSTGNLITTTATSLSAFGLLDAVNYYYNGKGLTEGRDRYVNTTCLLVVICGVIAAVVITSGNNLITDYFHNPSLSGVLPLIAFRPMISNCSMAFRNLQVSIGNAKFIALRNAIFSVCKLLLVAVVSIIAPSVTSLFGCILLLEFITMLWNLIVLERNHVHVRPCRMDVHLVKEILWFCIPMGIYIQANALSQSMDAFVIGYFESTEKLAIYTNCTTRLPIDFLSTSLLTVLIPTMTRCIHKQALTTGAELLKCYVRISYIVTWTLGMACILFAPQAVQFLYGEKYLDGTYIFALYILVDMIRFANLSLILSAKGNTATLMRISCGTLGLNFILNYLFYYVFGFIGPAIATIVTTILSAILIMKKSTAVLHTSIRKLFDGHALMRFACQLLVCGIIAVMIRNIMTHFHFHYLAVLILGGGSFVGAILLMNYKALLSTFRLLNETGNSI